MTGLTENQIAKLEAAYESAKEEYQEIAVRITYDMNYEAGSEPSPSHHWVDGERTDELLPGTCGVEISGSVAKTLKSVDYAGDQVTIIAGDFASYGEDKNELIIEEATVVAVADVKTESESSQKVKVVDSSIPLWDYS